MSQKRRSDGFQNTYVEPSQAYGMQLGIRVETHLLFLAHPKNSNSRKHKLGECKNILKGHSINWLIQLINQVE